MQTLTDARPHASLASLGGAPLKALDYHSTQCTGLRVDLLTVSTLPDRAKLIDHHSISPLSSRRNKVMFSVAKMHRTIREQGLPLSLSLSLSLPSDKYAWFCHFGVHPCLRKKTAIFVPNEQSSCHRPCPSVKPQ